MGGEDLRIPTSTWDDTPYPRIFLINDPESGLLGSDQAPIQHAAVTRSDHC